jgi:hypothetical protein
MDEIENNKLHGQYRPHRQGIAGNADSNTMMLCENIFIENHL